MKERRKFVRVNEDDEVSYCIIPDYRSERKLTQDLSLGGIRFICDHFIPPNSILKLTLRLKYAHKIINAIARSVWTRVVYDDESYETGAEFINIKNDDSKFLNYYLSKPR